jgi:hypothetical protein
MVAECWNTPLHRVSALPPVIVGRAWCTTSQGVAALSLEPEVWREWCYVFANDSKGQQQSRL